MYLPTERELPWNGCLTWKIFGSPVVLVNSNTCRAVGIAGSPQAHIKYLVLDPPFPCPLLPTMQIYLSTRSAISVLKSFVDELFVYNS